MIRVLVIAGVRLYREGLAQVLERRAELRVMCTAIDLEGAVTRMPHLEVDVALLDMSGDYAADRVRTLLQALPGVRVIGLGLSESSEEDVIECIQAGLSGYVPLHGSIEDLVKTLHDVSRGELDCGPRIAAGLARRLTQLDGNDSPRRGHLTQREQEVAHLLDLGLSNKEIASRLGIEVATVKNHIHNMLEKLCVRRRSEAVATLRRRVIMRSPNHLT